jgi:hypothetical protein
MKTITDEQAARIAGLCNVAGETANLHKRASDNAWNAINKIVGREVDAMGDMGADEFVGVIEYGETITSDEVKKYIAILKENREADGGWVRQ